MSLYKSLALLTYFVNGRDYVPVMKWYTNKEDTLSTLSISIMSASGSISISSKITPALKHYLKKNLIKITLVDRRM